MGIWGSRFLNNVNFVSEMLVYATFSLEQMGCRGF